MRCRLLGKTQVTQQNHIPSWIKLTSKENEACGEFFISITHFHKRVEFAWPVVTLSKRYMKASY